LHNHFFFVVATHRYIDKFYIS